MSVPSFLFTGCQEGAENTVKREIARGFPHWRFAFSRPGFLTFKWIGDAPPATTWRLRSTFARTYGWSVGFVRDDASPETTQEILTRLPESPADHLHVWHRQLSDREPGMPSVTDRARLGSRLDEHIPQLHSKLVALGRLSPTAPINHEAQRGARVIDVIVLDEQAWGLGWHTVSSFEQRWPGGVPAIAVPTRMVSRAYLKMREALLWSGLPCRPGDPCVEIGSAPGGACQALLEEGLVVTGIDPAPMDPLVLAHPRFTHVRKRGADVRRREYADYRWLFADSNVAPKHTLDTVEAIVTHRGVHIQGMILTLKLTQWNLADHVGDFAQRVRSWGFAAVRCRQLASSHQEICLVALRSRDRQRARRAASLATPNDADDVPSSAPNHGLSSSKG